MSLRNLFQDNLKSSANVKCNNLEVNDELTVGQNILADSFTAITSIAIGPNLLVPQEVGTHVTNWIGPFTVPGNIDYVKEGDWVTLDFPSIVGASSATSQITAETPLPVSLRPDNEVMNKVIITRDNSSFFFGRVRINTNGTIVIGTGVTGASFLNMNTAGFESFSIRYKV